MTKQKLICNNFASLFTIQKTGSNYIAYLFRHFPDTYILDEKNYPFSGLSQKYLYTLFGVNLQQIQLIDMI